MGVLQFFSTIKGMVWSNFYYQSAIVLHFQMRIFLVLGVFFVQVKMGKEMRCEGLFTAYWRHRKPPLRGGRLR